MTVALVLAGAAIVFVAVVMSLALARAAAIADRRIGPEDRRSAVRPESPGRRREDSLRAEVHSLRRSLQLAKARLAELEATRSEISELERTLEKAEAQLGEETAKRVSG